VVFYDLTSTYFEGKGPPELGANGYSRDGKPRNVQVLVGGLFERFTSCDSIFGMGNRPGLPIGKFAILAGPIMVGGHFIDINLTGKGSHGARGDNRWERGREMAAGEYRYWRRCRLWRDSQSRFPRRIMGTGCALKGQLHGCEVPAWWAVAKA
jgi:hypothetical protein